MRLIWDNEIDSYTITANSEATGYAVENIQDFQLTKVYRSTGDSDEWVKLDVGSGNTINPTVAGIVAHNLTNGGTYKIQGNATDSWVSPTVDETITHASGIMLEFFSGSALRYWRFHFADASNPDEYIEVGRLFLATYLTPTDTAHTNFPYELMDTSSVQESITGQTFGDEGVVFRLYRFNFPYWDNTTRTNIKTMYEDVKTVKPIILVPDENDLTSLPPDYVRIDGSVTANHKIGYTWNGDMAFREVK